MPVDLERVPTDRLGDDLVRTYRAGMARLETQIRAGLNAGLDPNRIGTPEQITGDATQAYRDRQLRAARLIIAELEATGRRAAPHVAAAAYRSAMVAVDRHAARAGGPELAPGIAGRFGGIHQRAVEVLAANMSDSLAGAAQRVGQNVDAVFARAAALEGAHQPGRSPLQGFPFIGRRTDDPWRQVALETIGAGNVGIDTRRQISRVMARRLVDQGVTDALTGFVDRAGRRWPLAHYTAMVARTTTREATTRATAARLTEHGEDLVTVSSHPHTADECTPYDGQTFSLSGDDTRYDALDDYPPFHPNCRHVLTPAGGSVEDYLSDLEDAVNGELAPEAVGQPRPRAGGGAPPRAPNEVPPPSPAAGERPRPPETTLAPPPGREGPPLGRNVKPVADAGTAARLDAQRVANAIASDPGPEEGAAAAWGKYVAKHGREANRALNEHLGEFNVKLLNQKWATDRGLRGQVLNGELSVDDLEDELLHEWTEREGKSLSRKHNREADYGYNRRAIPCFSCGHLKRRPADVCDYCGDDPVSTNYGGGGANYSRGLGAGGSAVGQNAASAAERMAFNRAYGYGSL